MITSDRQLNWALENLESLKKKKVAPVKNNIPEKIAIAGKEQVSYMIGNIESEIREYLAIKKNHEFKETIKSLDDLKKIPIIYRLYIGLSVDQFARQVNISARQIIRYEQNGYKNINLATYFKILQNLNLHISGIIVFQKKTKNFSTSIDLHSQI